MLLNRALEADYVRIIDLVNMAYRGAGPGASWNSEADFIEGERLTEALLREDLAAKPEAQLLTYRDAPNGELLGTVWLEPKDNAAEAFAKERGARRIRMTVVNARDTVIAWYERRGYALTGETLSFPYKDNRLGRPLRDGLHFVLLEKDI
jgi:hypothetical protein